ncbi:MAG: type IV pilin N-terminal domain-containing protein [Candidatus Methanoperedens sp.]|jgi:FlaG/FlaF family flagellin (archaellin)|nr:type IV pilin N-terminal domain-containing protein [Candidatus Methanoperedens sp.]PKL53274.1 MAG: hypothetical protein CVV36_08060 [Candidatus Methanoperedenaceae archaeon HGW-Methanoperedenaceae-1]
MVNFRESEFAASSVVGVILMVGLTVVMAGTISMSVFVYPLPSDAPDANIVIRAARGNLINFSGNEIVLAHKGGNTLRSDSVKIIIDGYGIEATKEGSVYMPLGAIKITYNNLEGYNYVGSGQRKDHWKYNLSSGDDTRIEDAKIVLNDTWMSGETIVLYGADGVNNLNKNNVDKKYKLTPGSKVTVTIIDIPTNQIIATSFATVKYSAEVVGH